MNDYGIKVGSALRAIRQMHSDTSRLLQDCDGQIGNGRKPLFEMATRDLKWRVDTVQWMAEGVYRYYDASDVDRGLVEGVMAAFIDEQNPERFEQPLLIVGQIKYNWVGQASLRSVCKEWDLWHAFFTWSATRAMGTVVNAETIPADRVVWARVVAVPLFTIESMTTVANLMARVRGARGSRETLAGGGNA